MKFITLFVLSLPLADLLLWWLTARAARHAPRAWRLFVHLFFACMLVGVFFVILGRRAGVMIPELPRAATTIVYLWHCALPLILAGWALTLIVGGIARRFRKPRYLLASEKDGVSRRQFLAASFATAPLVLAGGASAIALQQIDHFRVRRLQLPLASLPPELDGLTIAHVSDMHVGRLTQGRVVERIVEATNALESDLVVLTGDLVDYSLRFLPEALDAVSAMKGRHGVFLCEGNHDLYDNPEEFARMTHAAGVRLLVDETEIIPIRGKQVQLLGLRWGGPGENAVRITQRGDWAIQASLRGLLPKRTPEAFQILLAHHPHAFDFAEEVPLTLSGHTHGGQLMLGPEAGAGPLLFRYWSGLYEKNGRALVVSNGSGNWFPLRTQAPAEILHLTLTRKVS